MSPNRALVWDLPTRLFHWTLVLLVALQYASGEFGWLDLQWHVPAGYAALALLLFRAAWGFVGSDSARFAQFLRGPGAIRRYLRGGQRVVHTHNPLGGWAALLMLLWLLAIALTGLASSDDIDVAGPLVTQLDDATVRAATRWHHRLTGALPWIVAAHVGAVLVHEWRGERLVAAMLHGRRAGAAPVCMASTWRAVAALALSAVLVYLLVRTAST